jgi:hypothetical protein
MTLTQTNPSTLKAASSQVRLFLASVVPLSFGKLQLTPKRYPKTQLGMS